MGGACTDPAEQPACLKTPVTCINLLRCNMQVSTLHTECQGLSVCRFNTSSWQQSRKTSA